MTYTIITQTIPTASSEPHESVDNYGTFPEALFGVIELTDSWLSVMPIDTTNCLTLHRLGALQAWRFRNKQGETSFAAIVGGP